jgi:hypothetical protein
LKYPVHYPTLIGRGINIDNQVSSENNRARHLFFLKKKFHQKTSNPLERHAHKQHEQNREHITEKV